MSFNLVDRNYAKFLRLPTETKSELHKPFTEEELQILWKNSDNYVATIALVLIYTGLRPSELLDIKRDNVFLDKRYMIGGAKTSMGTNRRIPIAKKIYPFIKISMIYLLIIIVLIYLQLIYAKKNYHTLL